eukprot:3715884-Lingulodinium_polyedra.AAC.1
MSSSEDGASMNSGHSPSGSPSHVASPPRRDHRSGAPLLYSAPCAQCQPIWRPFQLPSGVHAPLLGRQQK